MNAQVYWIRAQHHSDITSEGYVGVSKNASKRWLYGHNWAHRKGRHENPRLANAISKYGWDNLIKTVVVISDADYCYELEAKLRSSKEIGWNLAIGGGKPPITRPRGADYVSPLKGVSRPTPWLIGKPSGTAGKPVSEETRAKLSARKKGTNQTPEQIAKRVASRRATLAAQGRTV
jgi:hypothetical protein